MTAISTAYPADYRNGSDLTGVKFNWMTVLGRAEMPEDAPKSIRGSYWLCRCVCGREIIIPRQYIVRREGAVSNWTRTATSSDWLSSAIEPGVMVSDRPVRAAPARPSVPHIGVDSRGNTKKSRTAMGVVR